MDADAPLVSIVIPSYNHARYLAAAIDSVLAQDYPRVELIVIDDGSTDGSSAILEHYRGRFHWEAQPNHGQAATMNRGWHLSRGEILGYLSADDTLARNAVSRSVAMLERHPDAALVYCDFNLVDPDGKLVRRVNAPDFRYEDMVADLVCHPGPGAFFRRAAFKKTGEWSSQYRQYGDYDFWLRLALQGPFVRVPEVLASFRVHPGSQSFTPASASAAEEPARIIDAFFGNCAVPSPIRALQARAASAAQLHSARLYVRAGQYRLAARAGRRAVTLYPANLFAWRTLRLAVNALFNRLGHRVLWTARRVLHRRG
jgi:glycosyltransferase involved in cell wall biosynthesis